MSSIHYSDTLLGMLPSAAATAALVRRSRWSCSPTPSPFSIGDFMQNLDRHFDSAPRSLSQARLLHLIFQIPRMNQNNR
ncbi:hypothetical protein Q3G72_016210 [Acer saccharum]|nr:hypothetical protein Q3G72_016210 [Acer saccharum]